MLARQEMIFAYPLKRTEKKTVKARKALFDKYVYIWRKAAKEVGLDVKFCAHSLRTSMATELTQLGFDQKFMNTLMGWFPKSKMHKRYNQAQQMNQAINMATVSLK